MRTDTGEHTFHFPPPLIKGLKGGDLITVHVAETEEPLRAYQQANGWHVTGSLTRDNARQHIRSLRGA